MELTRNELISLIKSSTTVGLSSKTIELLVRSNLARDAHPSNLTFDWDDATIRLMSQRELQELYIRLRAWCVTQRCQTKQPFINGIEDLLEQQELELIANYFNMRIDDLGEVVCVDSESEDVFEMVYRWLAPSIQDGESEELPKIQGFNQLPWITWYNTPMGRMAIESEDGGYCAIHWVKDSLYMESLL